jgi:PAS domain S-box-containing protein|tara:strand:- start:14322 stop:14858 length:537 start_codon:yes stop_codon:yes gene_type:complete
MEQRPLPVDEEIKFSADEIIVSKTDLKGRITYVNDVFCRVAEMNTIETLGKPHNIIRHPDMPRAIFKLLWTTLQKGEEIFAYIKNMSATGKYYWVIAHVTPSYDSNNNIIGYHSNRRYPNHEGIQNVLPLYNRLLQEEARHSGPKDGLDKSFALLDSMISESGKSYEEFIWGLVGKNA